MDVPFAETDFPADPYPGARPGHSFVNLDGECLPLRAAGPWRWEVGGTPLDDWLSDAGAVAEAARVPVLAYGSNACPDKARWLRDTLGLSGPVVVLRARCTDLVAVWAAHLRVRDGQRPATLAAEPGREEWHAVWLATREQVEVLDRCEGRGERYRLVRLDSGTVTAEDGTALPGVLAYTAAGEPRAPLQVGGRPVRCADVPQAGAKALSGAAGPDGLAVTEVAGAPKADGWPDTLFAYGTLRPGERAWRLAEPLVAGEPAAAELAGELFDTGRGYPALLPGEARVPGTLLRLRDPAAAFPGLDAYEGPEYRRVRAVTADGTLCWTYVWSAERTGFAPLPGGWPASTPAVD